MNVKGLKKACLTQRIEIKNGYISLLQVSFTMYIVKVTFKVVYIQIFNILRTITGFPCNHTLTAAPQIGKGVLVVINLRGS